MMPSKDRFVKNLSGISAKLDGKNYVMWAQSFETFLATHRKLKHLTQLPLDAKDSTFEDWYVEDSAVLSWMVNSMESSVAHGVMLLRPAKKIWDTLKMMYGYE